MAQQLSAAQRADPILSLGVIFAWAMPYCKVDAMTAVPKTTIPAVENGHGLL